VGCTHPDLRPTSFHPGPSCVRRPSGVLRSSTTSRRVPFAGPSSSGTPPQHDLMTYFDVILRNLWATARSIGLAAFAAAIAVTTGGDSASLKRAFTVREPWAAAHQATRNDASRAHKSRLHRGEG
jgi:hypothetical protein